MEYISTQEAARKWGVTVRTVARYVQAGKIVGALLMGKSWLIPRAAERPEDGRIKKNTRAAAEATRENQPEPFRYPIYYLSKYYKHRELLNPLEQQLYDGQEQFFQGNYKEAYALLKRLQP